MLQFPQTDAKYAAGSTTTTYTTTTTTTSIPATWPATGTTPGWTTSMPMARTMSMSPFSAYPAVQEPTDVMAVVHPPTFSVPVYNETVYLNVYHLVAPDEGFNKTANKIHCGMFHSGLEVYGVEYSYGGKFGLDPNTIDNAKSGIYRKEPGTAFPMLHKKLCLGMIQISPQQVEDIINNLGQTWKMVDYDIRRHNCNHFTKELARILGVDDVPHWVNRAAGVARKIPTRVLRRVAAREAKAQAETGTPPTDPGMRRLTKGAAEGYLDELLPRRRAKH